MKDKDIEKIRKLLRLGKSNSFTAEAELALQRAAELMKLHGFTEIDIGEADLDEKFGEIGQEDLDMKQYRSWEVTLVEAIATYFNCKVLQTSYSSCKKTTLAFVGRESNRITAVQMFDWLRSRTNQQAKAASRISQFRNDYRRGFAEGLLRRVRELKASENRSNSTPGLVPIDDVETWIKNNMQNIGHKQRQCFSEKTAAYLLGSVEAQQTGLNRQFGLKGLSQR